MRLVIRPMLDPRNEIDVTHQIVKAIAEELWRRHGGNDVLNWMEAQWHIEALLERSSPVHVPPLPDPAPALSPSSRPAVPEPLARPTGARRARRADATRRARRGEEVVRAL